MYLAQIERVNLARHEGLPPPEAYPRFSFALVTNHLSSLLLHQVGTSPWLQSGRMKSEDTGIMAPQEHGENSLGC